MCEIRVIEISNIKAKITITNCFAFFKIGFCGFLLCSKSCKLLVSGKISSDFGSFWVIFSFFYYFSGSIK